MRNIAAIHAFQTPYVKKPGLTLITFCTTSANLEIQFPATQIA